VTRAVVPANGAAGAAVEVEVVGVTVVVVAGLRVVVVVLTTTVVDTGRAVVGSEAAVRTVGEPEHAVMSAPTTATRPQPLRRPGTTL
jgi:hypothetical protein